MALSPSLEAASHSYSRISQHFMEPEVSVPYSQEPSILFILSWLILPNLETYHTNDECVYCLFQFMLVVWLEGGSGAAVLGGTVQGAAKWAVEWRIL
jgi:hypothetical protein